MFFIYMDGETLSEPFDESLIIFNPKLTLEIGKAGSLLYGLPTSHKLYAKP